jgi:CIC family chloride channel protein
MLRSPLFTLPKPEDLRKLTDTVLLGVAGAGAALLFGWMLRVAQNLFLVHLAGYVMPALDNTNNVHPGSIGPHGLWLIPISTTLGGLLSGLLVYTFAPEAEGHGTDTVVAAFHRTAGVIRARVAPLKMVASALTIGSGGSAGREGPTALITAGFGSIYGGWLRRSEQDRRFLIIVGMAAGLSAVFRSPIGTAIFAVEVLYSSMEFESSLLLYTMLASVIAYAVNGAFVGLHPLFAVPATMQEPANRAYGWFALLGVACGIIGTVLPVFFYKMRDWFRLLPVPLIFRPAIGGLLVGLLALRWPQLLGGGYAWMQMAINGDVILKLALLLAVLKILALSLTVSSGGSGGVFAPSMYVGAMIGAAIGLLLHLPPAAFAVVGMAALFGAAARVPFATLLMVVEMTGGYQLLVPAGLAVVIAYMVQGALSAPFRHKSLYEAQVPTPAQSAAHYADSIRSALSLISNKQLHYPQLGSVELLDLLQTGISLDMGGGQQLYTAVVTEASPLVGQTLMEISKNLIHEPWKVLGIFREDEGFISPGGGTALRANDRLLVVCSPQVLDTLAVQLVFRASGVPAPVS